MTSNRLTDIAFKLAYDLGTALEGHPALKDVNLTQIQMRVLRCVHDRQNATPAHIAETIERDKGHVTRLLTELETLELIALAQNPADRRSKIVTLTEKARDIFARIRAAEEPIFQQATNDIASNKLDIFFKVADQISANLRK